MSRDGRATTRRTFLRAASAGVGLLGAGVTAVGGQSTADGGDSGDASEGRPGAWNASVPDLPEPMADPGAAVLDGTLYAYGGFYPHAGETVASTYAYDPDRDEGWREREPAPAGRWLPCGVAAGGSLYSFGGQPGRLSGASSSDRIFRFRPGEGWTDLTARDGVRCPEPAYGMQGVHDPEAGVIWLAGGATVSDGPRRNVARLWTFDPETGAVDEGYAPLPAGKHVFTMGLVDRTLYVVGGYRVDGGPGAATWGYDLDADEWRPLTSAPLNLLGATRNDPVIDGKLYVTHGLNWGERVDPDRYPHARVDVPGRRLRYFYATCFEYDPTKEGTDAGPWRRMADARHPRDGVANGVVDGTLYVVGGRATERPQPKGERAVEAFTPA